VRNRLAFTGFSKDFIPLIFPYLIQITCGEPKDSSFASITRLL
jgi:hypothetical protein